jgi:hypothetical protein
MESRAAWDAENRKALETVRQRAYTIARRMLAAAPDQPSPYGPYIDAVARKGLFLDVLADIAQVRAKSAALAAKIAAGYPESSSAARLFSAPRKLTNMDNKAAAEILESMAAATLELADVLRGTAADPAETVHYG